ncbi:MAG: hypothetical protein H6Q15_2493 [Bacteroidetes bacterium]|nr:hypothetical protein [Bacteroidota bacterium]
MLKDTFLKYCLFKVKFLFVKQNFKRDPFSNQLRNQPISWTVGELIDFIGNKYAIDNIEVKFLHNNINWSKFFINRSKKEVNELDNFHMRLVVNSNLRYPIILKTSFDDELIEVLDGYHRIKKAYMLKKKYIRAYVIPEIDLKQFKEQRDEKI